MGTLLALPPLDYNIFQTSLSSFFITTRAGTRSVLVTTPSLAFSSILRAAVFILGLLHYSQIKLITPRKILDPEAENCTFRLEKIPM